MARVTQVAVPSPFLEVFRQAGIGIKKFKTAGSFERELKRFLKRNHVLHLSTSKNNTPRSTPLEYKVHGLHLFVLSEGGAKFEYLKENKKISFSIAEPYDSAEDYWGYKGIQGWGRARIYRRKEDPVRFNEAFRKMNLKKNLIKLGMKDLPPGFAYRIIEIVPDKIKYGNPREGVFRTTWHRK